MISDYKTIAKYQISLKIKNIFFYNVYTEYNDLGGISELMTSITVTENLDH